MSDIEQRVRERAYAFGWKRTGPEGSDKAHRDMAKETIATEAEESAANPVFQKTNM